ncbi:MAG: hypothetical protein ABIG89_05135 [Candidatus Woesearchaeota archaeon]
MKKMLLLLISLLIGSLMIISVFAYPNNLSNSQIKQYADAKQCSEKYCYFNVYLHKGWNLMPEPLMDFARMEENAMDDNSKNILENVFSSSYRYLYVPNMKKYLVFKNDNSDFQTKEEMISYNEQGYIHFTPSWVYMKNSAVISIPYYVPNINEYSDLKFRLIKGWNLLTITPHFYKEQITEGTCNIENIYAWDANAQNWKFIPKSKIFGDDDFVGYSTAIKTANNCELGTGSSAGTPPALPN